MAEDNGETAEDPVAWDVAEQVARRLLRSSPLLDLATLRRLDVDFAAVTEQGEALVEATTGMRSQAGKAVGKVTDRTGWIEANVVSFQRLIRPLAARLSAEQAESGQRIGSATQSLAGVEVGVILAWMSRRVLGQYDLMPSDASGAGDVVYYVGPNVVGLERRHGFPPREFRLWIALHELTHRMQFTAVPWMREHFLGLVERGIGLVTPDARSVSDRIAAVVTQFRSGVNPLHESGVIGLFASPEQLAMLKEAQALMSLLEGHGNYVMTRAGKDEIPGARRFARVLAERRANTKGVAKVFQQLVGLDAKLRQYAEGEHFVDAIARIGGDELLAKVWIAPEMLPTLEEIRAPELWVERAGDTVPA